MYILSPAPDRQTVPTSSIDSLDNLPKRLLVLVLNDPERLDPILTGFLELGITGATVVHTEGMGRILSDAIPIFAGLRAMVGDERPRNVTVFSVVEEPVVQPALDMVKQVCGDLADPSTGIAFVLPVERVVGLAPALDRARDEGGGPSGEAG